MYCVVQIGSRMFRFECGTTRSTLSCATAETVISARRASRPRMRKSPREKTRSRVAQRMARIAIGGFQHETNTFAPTKADYAAFEAGGGWPGVQYGDPLFAAVEGANIPAAGAITALRAAGHALVATAWAAA